MFVNRKLRLTMAPVLFCSLFLITSVQAEPVDDVILTGTIQMGVLYSQRTVPPASLYWELAGSDLKPKTFGITMRPAMNSEEWTKLLKSGGEATVGMDYSFDYPTAFNPMTTRAALTRSTTATIRMVITPEGEYKEAGLYIRIPNIDVEDLRTLVARDRKNPSATIDLTAKGFSKEILDEIKAEGKSVWDFSALTDQSPTLNIFLKASTHDIVKRGQEVHKKLVSGWGDCVKCCCGHAVRLWTIREVSIVTPTEKVIKEITFNPFGPLNKEDTSHLCMPLEAPTGTNNRVERRLCFYFTPENLENFAAGCPKY